MQLVINIQYKKMNSIKKILFPALFWLALFFFLFFTIGGQLVSGFIKFKLSFFATNSFILLHYTNIFILKRFFERKKLKIYIFCVVLLIILVTISVHTIISALVIHEKIDYITITVNVIVPLIISTGYYFSRKGFQTQIAFNKLQTKQLEAEMQLLKMQIQPHFLFNTLNNIYATNLTQHAAANEMILQLAEILRFQLESHKKQFIPLTEEIEIIENYVALEKVRLYDTAVSITKTGDFENHVMLSLLLLPLIENAFKYGKNRIDIALSIEKNTFIFECKNEIVANITQKSSNKIGLQNVEKRLELVYADRYTFIAKATENNTFVVFLKIAL